jgi:hypothetical protein
VVTTLRDIDQVGRVLGFDLTEFPGVIAPVLFTLIGLEALSGQLRLAGTLSVPAELLQLGLVGASILAGVLTYVLGNFWDDRVFDPRYGPTGTWLNREGRSFGVLTPAADLRDARLVALQMLRPGQSDARGLYKIAKRIVVERGLWHKTSSLLAMSKAFRSLIWPALLLSVIALVGAAGVLFTLWPGELVGLLVCALAALGFALLSFVPYLELRLQHMIRLYDLAGSQPN